MNSEGCNVYVESSEDKSFVEGV